MKRWYLIKKINDIMKPITLVIYLLKHVFNEVRDNCHEPGIYREPACKICNLRYKQQNFIHVMFHNGSVYDFNLLCSE